MRRRRLPALAPFFCVVVVPLLVPERTPVAGGVRFAAYPEVRQILAALTDVLPKAFTADDESTRESAWTSWAAQHDREIRERLEGGDEDTIVNWLLLGTSFTSRPRAFLDASSTDSDRIVQLVAARARDLTAALQSPDSDERRLYARDLFERKGYRLDSTKGRDRLIAHLEASVVRVAGEQAAFADELAQTRRLGDATEEFAARSKLFRTRGLSLDTSFLPDFALEQSLRALDARGLISKGRVRDVALVGPGLDFSDKASGYDFYPQQTLQPFVLMDSLLRLGLVDQPSDVRITTLDVSPRVNAHLRRAGRRAGAGSPYTMRVPLDTAVSWKPDLLAYRNALGDRIGTIVQSNHMPGAPKEVRVRTIRVRPQVVLQVQAEDCNVVLQRLTDRQFDLVIATNVFVYYDVLDQSLAMSNIEAMLRPGGLFLTNNSLLELPGSRLRSIGYLTTRYSDRQDDGDHIVWYRWMAG